MHASMININPPIRTRFQRQKPDAPFTYSCCICLCWNSVISNDFLDPSFKELFTMWLTEYWLFTFLGRQRDLWKMWAIYEFKWWCKKVSYDSFRIDATWWKGIAKYCLQCIIAWHKVINLMILNWRHIISSEYWVFSGGWCETKFIF